MCRDYDVPFLGGLPLDIRIREQADSGRPTVVADPDGKVAEIYREIARKVGGHGRGEGRGLQLEVPVDRGPEHLRSQRRPTR